MRRHATSCTINCSRASLTSSKGSFYPAMGAKVPGTARPTRMPKLLRAELKPLSSSFLRTRASKRILRFVHSDTGYARVHVSGARLSAWFDILTNKTRRNSRRTRGWTPLAINRQGIYHLMKHCLAGNLHLYGRISFFVFAAFLEISVCSIAYDCT